MMLRTAAAAAAIMLISPALAVPSSPTLSYEHSLVLSAPLPQTDYAAVEAELSALMTQTTGMAATAATEVQSASRRLQTGSTLSITYIVTCGSSCDAVSAVRAYQLPHFAPYPTTDNRELMSSMRRP